MVIARPIGEVLGDGTRHDSDEGSWQCEDAAEALARKLTVEQMNILAGWLGLNQTETHD